MPDPSIHPANDLARIVAEAGRLVLENGGETSRAEETVETLARALGNEDTHCFITPTGLLLTVTDPDGSSCSLIRRIRARTTDLTKVSEVNDLVRRLAARRIPADGFEKRLAAIDALPAYPLSRTLPAAGLATGFFALLFGGVWQDFFAALATGCLLFLLASGLRRLGLNDFFVNALGGAFASFCALALVHFGLGLNASKILIGVIMLLVPGLAITNAIRDTIAGELVSGLSRGVEAVVAAFAIAIGSGLAMHLWHVAQGTVLR